MSRAIWVGVLLAALGAAGCWEIGGGGTKGKPPGQPVGSALPVRPPLPVTPDQVTDGNAHQKTQALRAEMLDAQQNLPSGTIAEGSAAGRPTH
jgi:hypothetical protein